MQTQVDRMTCSARVVGPAVPGPKDSISLGLGVIPLRWSLRGVSIASGSEANVKFPAVQLETFKHVKNKKHKQW